VDVYKTTLDFTDPDNPKYVRQVDPNTGKPFSINDLDFSFNWWLSDSNNAVLDETPMGDAPKYARMSNLQDDYHAVANTAARRTGELDYKDPTTFGTASQNDLTNWPQPTREAAIARGITDLPPAGPRRVDDPGTEDTRFLVSYGGGPFTELNPRERLHITVGVIMGFTFKNLLQNAYWAKTVYDNYYKGPTPPPSPNLTVEPYGDGRVKLTWDNSPESTVDPISGQRDFEGYRVWRSRSRILDSFQMIAEFDIIDGDSGVEGDLRFDVGLPGENPDHFACQAFATDSGYVFIDRNVTENFTYFYAVTSFDRGEPANGVASLESSINNNMTLIVPSTPAGKKLVAVNDDCEETKPVANGYSLDDILVIPNPYRGDRDYSSYDYSGWEDARSEYSRVIAFTNLPDGDVTIRIYTVAGDLVQTLTETLSPTGTSTIYWDMLTRSQQRIVSGVYIYSVESKYGTKVGKFAVIR